MASKPAMIIDVLTASKDEDEDLDEVPAEERSAGGHDALIRDIQAKLDELRAALAKGE